MSQRRPESEMETEKQEILIQAVTLHFPGRIISSGKSDFAIMASEKKMFGWL